MDGFWQDFKDEAHKRISIDGQPVTCIDYKALHPGILYAQAGASLAGDAYRLEGWPRDLVKHAFEVMVEADDVADAAVQIAEDTAMGEVAPRGSDAAVERARKLIDAIREKHQAIGWAFFSGAGQRLVELDGTIAETLMLLMLRRGILVLPVHDTFLVVDSQAEWLEEAMQQAAHAVGVLSVGIREE